MGCTWLAFIHSVQGSLLVCQGLGLACNHCPQEFCCAFCGLLWLQTRFAGGLGARRDLGPGPCVLCMLKSSLGCGKAGDLHPHRLGRCKWLMGKAPSTRPRPWAPSACLPSAHSCH